MFHSSRNNRKIARLHGRCLTIIYNEKQSTFMKLLEKDNSVSIYQQDLQILAADTSKLRSKQT